MSLDAEMARSLQKVCKRDQAARRFGLISSTWKWWFGFWQGEREGDFPLAIAANI